MEYVDKYRQHFAWFFCGAVLLLVYASILPVEYRTCSLEVAWNRFTHLPWLDIQLYGRADWVANFLVVLPLGWLGAAAIDCGRSSHRFLLVFLPWMICFLCFVVVGIEYLQAWFPPRTQSLNDIAAGCMGAVAGPFIWIATGRWTVNTILKISYERSIQVRLWHTALIYSLVLLLFALLPLDLVMSMEDFKEKLDIGRVELVPDLSDPIKLVKPASLSVIKVVPLSLLLCFSRGVRIAIVFSLGVTVMCEIVQLPVFTRTASLLDVFFSAVGAWVGVLLFRFHGFFTPILRRAGFWFFIASLSLVATQVAIVWKSNRVVISFEELSERWKHFFGWPMASYYYQAEFSALNTLIYKFIYFAFIGTCYGLAVAVARPKFKNFTKFSSVVLMVTAAVGIEVSQVYLAPHVPSGFDIVIYTGTMLMSSDLAQRIRRVNSLEY